MFNFFQPHGVPSFWVSLKEQPCNLDERSEQTVKAARTWGAKFQEGSKIYHSELHICLCILLKEFASLGDNKQEEDTQVEGFPLEFAKVSKGREKRVCHLGLPAIWNWGAKI